MCLKSANAVVSNWHVEHAKQTSNAVDSSHDRNGMVCLQVLDRLDFNDGTVQHVVLASIPPQEIPSLPTEVLHTPSVCLTQGIALFKPTGCTIIVSRASSCYMCHKSEASLSEWLRITSSVAVDGTVLPPIRQAGSRLQAD